MGDGWGTDEARITRVLGSLNKADIGRLKGRYIEKYDRDLDDDLKKEISGSWGDSVLTWVLGVDPTMGQEEMVEDVNEEEVVEEAEEAEEEEEADEPPPEEEKCEEEEASSAESEGAEERREAARGK